MSQVVNELVGVYVFSKWDETCYSEFFVEFSSRYYIHDVQYCRSLHQWELVLAKYLKMVQIRIDQTRLLKKRTKKRKVKSIKKDIKEFLKYDNLCRVG